MKRAQIGSTISGEVVEAAAIIRSALGLKLADLLESAVRNEVRAQYENATITEQAAIRAVAESRGFDFNAV